MVENNKLIKLLNPAVENKKVAKKSLNQRLKAKKLLNIFQLKGKNVFQEKLFSCLVENQQVANNPNPGGRKHKKLLKLI